MDSMRLVSAGFKTALIVCQGEINDDSGEVLAQMPDHAGSAGPQDATESIRKSAWSIMRWTPDRLWME